MLTLVLCAIGIASSVLAVPSASLALSRRDHALSTENRYLERHIKHLEDNLAKNDQDYVSHNSQGYSTESRLTILTDLTARSIVTSSKVVDDEDVQSIEARTASQQQRRTGDHKQHSALSRPPERPGSVVRAEETRTLPLPKTSNSKANKARAHGSSYEGPMFRAEDRRRLATAATSSASTISPSRGSPRLTSPFAISRPPVQSSAQATQPHQSRPPTNSTRHLPRPQPPIVPPTQRPLNPSRQSSGPESIAPKSQIPTPSTSRASSTIMADGARYRQAYMLEQAMEKHFPTQEPKGFIPAGWKGSQSEAQKKDMGRSRTL